MSKQLFKAILGREFYLSNKDLITEDLFVESNELKDLFKVVQWAYEQPKIVSDLTPQSLRLLYDTRCPVDSEAKKKLVNIFLDTLEGEPKLPLDMALLALRQSRVNKVYNQAAQELVQSYKQPDLNKIKDMLMEAERLVNNEATSQDTINMDIDYLLSRTCKNSRWKFNIPALSDMCGGIGDGIFTLIAGRVNSGKSLAGISFCFSPLGFADQGAKVLYLCNEEDAAFTGIRAVSSYTGMTLAEINADKAKAGEVFSQIKDKVIPVDNARISMGGLAKLVEKYKPDIVVADMLDHIQVGGDYAREDLRLGQIYRQAREIAKVYRCAFIGVSQTSAESDGKLHYGFDALANSKTDKPAACDLILLLGQAAPDDNGNYSPARAINVAKNKITGRHGAVAAMIVPEKSRLIA